MGNFHCIPSSCAKVVYRKYLPPVVRWRYPDEDWNEIEGDDYKINSSDGQCYTKYDIAGTYYNGNSTIGSCEKALNFTGTFDGKFLNLVVYYHQQIGRNVFGVEHELENQIIERTPLIAQSGILIALSSCQTFNRTERWGLINPFPEVTSITRVDNLPDNCGECTFQVFKNNQLVFERITNAEIGCPEVEKLDCRLSDVYKEIKVDKLPWVEGIEVINFARDFIFKREIPNHCLNIYSTNIYQSILPINDIYPDYIFKGQICSVPLCPPPEYQVICDCNCIECPDGTCAVQCEEHICCYDTNTGKAVKQIAMTDYCGGTV